MSYILAFGFIFNYNWTSPEQLMDDVGYFFF